MNDLAENVIKNIISTIKEYYGVEEYFDTIEYYIDNATISDSLEINGRYLIKSLGFLSAISSKLDINKINMTILLTPFEKDLPILCFDLCINDTFISDISIKVLPSFIIPTDYYEEFLNVFMIKSNNTFEPQLLFYGKNNTNDECNNYLVIIRHTLESYINYSLKETSCSIIIKYLRNEKYFKMFVFKDDFEKQTSIKSFDLFGLKYYSKEIKKCKSDVYLFC